MYPFQSESTSYSCPNVKELLRHRRSRPEVLCKKGVFRKFVKFTGKHLYQRLFLNKVAGLRPATLLKKESLAQVFSCEFFEISKNKQFWFYERSTYVRCREEPQIINHYCNAYRVTLKKYLLIAYVAP